MAYRTLVTGGAGFIGSHLVRRLLMEGEEVICLDNFFTGSKANLRDVLDHPNLELVRHDVVQPIMLEVDRVYNLACPASPVHYQFNPVKTVKTNVLGTLNMLGLAKRGRGQDPPGLHLRGLRRSQGPPPDRIILGPRQPCGVALLLRRGQESGRDAHGRLPPPERRGN